MRRVAPDSAGSAASQKSWFSVYWKLRLGRLTATTLHICQTAKARNRAGIDIQRLTLAIALPSRTQKALSSGVQTVSRRPRRVVDEATSGDGRMRGLLVQGPHTVLPYVRWGRCSGSNSRGISKQDTGPSILWNIVSRFPGNASSGIEACLE